MSWIIMPRENLSVYQTRIEMENRYLNLQIDTGAYSCTSPTISLTKKDAFWLRDRLDEWLDSPKFKDDGEVRM